MEGPIEKFILVLSMKYSCEVFSNKCSCIMILLLSPWPLKVLQTLNMLLQNYFTSVKPQLHTFHMVYYSLTDSKLPYKHLGAFDFSTPCPLWMATHA